MGKKEIKKRKGKEKREKKKQNAFFFPFVLNFHVSVKTLA